MLLVPLALYTPLTLPVTYIKFDDPPPPPFTVKVKLWLAGLPTPLLAVKVSKYVPPLPDAGVPLNVPVPFPLSLNVTPLGSAPVSVSVGVGAPVVVTVKLPAVPTVNVVVFALVTAGTWFTFSVKLWLAVVPTPLLAVMVIG